MDAPGRLSCAFVFFVFRHTFLSPLSPSHYGHHGPHRRLPVSIWPPPTAFFRLKFLLSFQDHPNSFPSEFFSRLSTPIPDVADTPLPKCCWGFRHLRPCDVAPFLTKTFHYKTHSASVLAQTGRTKIAELY